ncbi:hypothetical protein CISIN_1g0399681mg, partial [Citrus sinensis]
MPVHAIASSAGVAGSFVGKLLAQENHDLACDATTERLVLKELRISDRA